MTYLQYNTIQHEEEGGTDTCNNMVLKILC